MQASQKLVEFVASEEGVVTKAYRDPVGILTIGVGHTSAAGGLVVKAGMTITRQQAFDLLREDLVKFLGRCETAMPDAKKYEIEGAASFDFNTGAIYKASWVGAWKAGNDADATRRFKLWNKAGGKVLRGLVARREREADIIFLNKWPSRQDQAKTPHFDFSLQKDLRALGYLKDAATEDMKVIDEAVKAFQQKNGLVVDGIVGPATRATLQRVLASKRANQGSVVAGAATGGGALPIEAIDSTTALVVVVGIVIAGIALGWAYRNRGRLFGIRQQITSGEK